MKANSPGISSQDRPPSGRRKARRAFAPTSSPLEGRTLLSTPGLAYGPVAAPAVAAPAVIGPVSMTTAVSLSPASASAMSASPVFFGGGGIGTEPGPPPPGSRPSTGQSSPPHDRLKDRVGLAVASVMVAGKVTPEFALADTAQDTVTVKVGFQGPLTVLSTAEGIDNPCAVVLKDVNGDGLPDLIVANTGNDNVLVFPGLVGGGVGPELEGGRGFAVGQEPAGITVSDLTNDGNQDLIVSNRGSNDVTILDGRGRGPNWTLVPGQTLAAGVSPVRTVVQDINVDGKPDLFILDSVSNDVVMYQGLGEGRFATAMSARFAVGMEPTEMFVGRFDHRPGLDLVTVNTGSDDVSFIAGINTIAPRTMTFTSGGTQPDAAFAVDLNHDGVLDLVVANGGDGRVALLQGGSVGLQLAQVISRSDLPAPTGLAPEFVTGNRVDFFAASAGEDAAQLLQFDLGSASAFLSLPLSPSSSAEGAGSDLVAQLVPFGDSDLVLIAVLWEGDDSSRSKTSEFEDRGLALSPVPYAKTSLEGVVEGGPDGAPALPSPIAIPPDDPAYWLRYVTGTEPALGDPRYLLALAPMDSEAGDARRRVPTPPDRPPIDPDLEAATDAIDEALRSLNSQGPAPVDAAPVEDLGRVGLGTADAPARRRRAASIPAVASSIMLASRLILKASPPRPPSIRRVVGRRLEVTGLRRVRPTPL